MNRDSKVEQAVTEILAQPALNGVYRLTSTFAGSMPVLDGRALTDRRDLLGAIGRALDFPDYYGANWDALDECLRDLSWRDGPISLLIEHAEAIPDAAMATLVEIFLQAAQGWAEQERVFSLFVAGLERRDIPLLA
ncbi:MAG: hypothetical protein B7Y41_00055 [Hydrogenophilales bacterium 28-61-23]|nr:MAG: hypothetical protein B7Y41_00055 [Hydrogenophilales bacterium 28-61-23]